MEVQNDFGANSITNRLKHPHDLVLRLTMLTHKNEDLIVEAKEVSYCLFYGIVIVLNVDHTDV